MNETQQKENKQEDLIPKIIAVKEKLIELKKTRNISIGLLISPFLLTALNGIRSLSIGILIVGVISIYYIFISVKEIKRLQEKYDLKEDPLFVK